MNDDQLDGCSDLEKLLAGCEIIAAVDRVDLLLVAWTAPSIPEAA